MKKIIGLLLIAGIAFGVYYFVSSYLENKNAWKIEVINDEINVRELPNATSNLLDTVFLGDVFKVLELNEEDQKFVWFKIEYAKDKFGWVASARQVPYVKEYNNPNMTEIDEESYIVDYSRPIIRYFDEVYAAYDIDNISYDHLEIEEDSEYSIKSNIYYEQFPDPTPTNDNPAPQYWIEYIVTDEFDNTESKMQKITFEIEPDISDVLIFEER